MNQLTSLTLASLLIVGCSSGTESTAPQRLSSCLRSDRQGTYLQHMTERSGGKCGPVNDQLVQIDPNGPTTTTSPGGVTCKLTSSSWSEGDCRVDSTVDCTSPGGTSKSISLSRQTAQDGS